MKYMLLLSGILFSAFATAAPETKKGSVWLCDKCRITVVKTTTPSPFHCPGGAMHRWTRLGEYGANPHLCRKCGIRVYTDKTPSVFRCPSGGMHQWDKL